MNLVNSIARRQLGFGYTRDYDLALCRLKCSNEDVYRGISPNVNAPDFNPEPPVFACRFCTSEGYEQILALANEDGSIALQNTAIKTDCSRPLEGTQAHCNAIFDVAWMPGELKLVTVSGDHTARLWDVAGSSIKQIEYFHAHTRSVKTAVFRHQDKAVFATGARDGSINVWDIRASHNDQPKPDNCISNAHSVAFTTREIKQRRTIHNASRAQSITGLAFQDDFSLISCAAGDGFIKVWDLRKNYSVHKRDPVPKHIMNYTGNSTRNGFSSLLICPYRITLYASCMDNIVYAYNVSSYNPKPVAEYYGHQNCTYYVKTCLSPDGRYLASGSSDELAYIWNTTKPGGPLVKLVGHTEEVTCIAWCSSGETKIVTCSDDSYHRLWRVNTEQNIDNEHIQIRGQAEIVLNKTVFENSRLETTPTVSRRGQFTQEHTPGSDTNSGIGPGPSTSNTKDESRESNSTGTSGSGIKRSYSQMMAEGKNVKGKPILSPIQENLEVFTKRAFMENRGARRLFSSVADSSYGLNKGYESDEPSTSSGVRGARTEPRLFSPTLNLPNFVIDGTAPHLPQASPEKSKENVDWLTRIRKERYEQRVGKGSAEKSNSPKPQVTPGRRSSRSRSTEPQRLSKVPKSPSLSLLDFFKVTGKDSIDDISTENNDTSPPKDT